MAATLHRQVTCPVLFHALIDDASSGVDLGDAIGSGAGVSLQGRRAEVATLPVVLGQDRQLADDQRQLPGVGGGELEAHRVIVQGGHTLDVGVVGPVEGVTLLGEQFEAEDDVSGRQGLAVVEACLGAQVELDPLPTGVQSDTFGQQAVEREGLVGVALEQGVVDARNPGGGGATNDKGVGGVEAAPHGGLGQAAPLGRLGVDVGKVREACGECRLTVERKSVHGGDSVTVRRRGLRVGCGLCAGLRSEEAEQAEK